MTTTTETMTVSLDTTCACDEWERCDGECWQDASDSLDYLLDRWCDTLAIDSETLVTVNGNGVGWTRASVTATVAVKDIRQLLDEDGDYRLAFTLSSDSEFLTATRYSHDEPTGASFEFAIAKRDCYECDKPEGGDIPRHANGTTIYLCSYCDRITPDYR